MLRNDKVKTTVAVAWPAVGILFFHLSPDPVQMLQWYLKPDNTVIQVILIFSILSHAAGLFLCRRIKQPVVRLIARYFFGVPLYFAVLWRDVALDLHQAFRF